MKIYTKLVIDIASGRMLEEESYEYPDSGPIALCKETEDQKNAASTLTSLTTTLQGSYGTMFAGQQAALDILNRNIDAVVKAGPSQYGFSAQQDAALRTQASEGNAAAYRSAAEATGAGLAAVGGGNVFLPSGTSETIKAGIAERAAAQESSEQLGITEAGWQQGTQNYNTAVAAGLNAAKIYDPAQYASLAEKGATDAFSAQTEIANEPTTAGVVGGILGNVAGTALSSFTGGFGTTLGTGAAKSVLGG